MYKSWGDKLSGILDAIKSFFSGMCAGSNYVSTYVSPPDQNYGHTRANTIKQIEESQSIPLYGDRKIKHEQICKELQKEYGYGLTEYEFKEKYNQRIRS